MTRFRPGDLVCKIGLSTTFVYIGHNPRTNLHEIAVVGQRTEAREEELFRHLSISEIVDRVDRALRRERDILRGRPIFDLPESVVSILPGPGQTNHTMANLLNAVLETTDQSKIRIWEMIR